MRAPSVALAVTLAACSSPYLHHGRGSKACSSLRRCSPILAFRSRTTCGVTCGVTCRVTCRVTGSMTGSVPLCWAPRSSFICHSARSRKAHGPPTARHNSPALLPRRASRDSLNLFRESRGSITRGSTCSGSAWDGLPHRPGGDACLPRTRGSCRRRTSIANRPRPPGCAWRSGPGTSGRAR